MKNVLTSPISKINFILKDSVYHFSVEGYDELLALIELSEEVDFSTCFSIAKDCNSWSLYLQEIDNILEIYVDHFERLEDTLLYKKDVVKKHVGKDGLISSEVKAKCFITETSISSFTENIDKQIAQYKSNASTLKKVRKQIQSQIKYLEAVFYSINAKSLKLLNQFSNI